MPRLRSLHRLYAEYRTCSAQTCAWCGRPEAFGFNVGGTLSAGYGSTQYDCTPLGWTRDPDPILQPEGPVCDDCIGRAVAEGAVVETGECSPEAAKAAGLFDFKAGVKNVAEMLDAAARVAVGDKSAVPDMALCSLLGGQGIAAGYAEVCDPDGAADRSCWSPREEGERFAIVHLAHAGCPPSAKQVKDGWASSEALKRLNAALS